MRLILRQRPAVPKYVRNVTSQAPAPHRIPVPASTVPQTRAALTDVLLIPVLHPVVRLFVPLVIRNRIPVPPPARVLLQNRVHRLNLSNPPNLRKLNAEKCIQILMNVQTGVLALVTEAGCLCLLPVKNIAEDIIYARHGNQIW